MTDETRAPAKSDTRHVTNRASRLAEAIHRGRQMHAEAVRTKAAKDVVYALWLKWKEQVEDLLDVPPGHQLTKYWAAPDRKLVKSWLSELGHDAKLAEQLMLRFVRWAHRAGKFPSVRLMWAMRHQLLAEHEGILRKHKDEFSRQAAQHHPTVGWGDE